MNGMSRRGMDALKGVLVTACLVAGIAWPASSDFTSCFGADCSPGEKCSGGGTGRGVDEPLSVTKDLNFCARTCNTSEDCDNLGLGLCATFGDSESGGVCVTLSEPGVITGGPTSGGAGKTEFPTIPLVPPESPEPPALPSPDSVLSTEYGVPLTNDRYGLYFVDSLFQGPRGAEFKKNIIAAADESHINRGLLATFAATEPRTGDVVATFTGTERVRMDQIGLDYWGSTLRNFVLHTLNLTDADIPSTKMTEARRIELGLPSLLFKNEAQKITGPAYEFPNGMTALRALAATIRAEEIRLSRSREVGGIERWNNLPVGRRFELLRLYFNAGGKIAGPEAQRAVNGVDIRVTSGPATRTVIINDKSVVKTRPRRAATIREAQAKHVSQEIFERPVDD
jgi:hypothetical protein